jgi:hypothetical protein
VLNMQYYDSIPWPEAPDGYGRTLELINDTLDPNLSSSWFVGCIGGSPGGPYIPCTEDIIFSEINYKSSPFTNAGDWVELLNTSSNAIDISNWKFRDDDDTHNFNIPLNTVIPPSGRIVILFDSLLFTNRFPSVTNYVGQFNFGLSSNGDAIRLFDATGRLYQSVIYDDLLPWPQGANGNGYTLELVNANGNLSDGSNWQNGCPEGSPGSEFIFPCAVASTSNTMLSSLSFFPNPTNGLVNVQLPNFNADEKEIKIEVFNYIGDNIYSEHIKSTRNNFSIDLQGHAKGIYLTRININGETIDRLIILN